ncbi:glycosyltransferase family 4 protein [Bradyrhizobium xenonodulans]|uniref:Glycosyltransferase family 4 protein n=1 Tax=Bradyrhizobium xenonodulans TaxID=2736875 RepID=A0ABY7MPL0_9BRAD|nr:glycosyltransferase family 4 protein [Bradyrhizobium xenonodulans]WBL80330.1 glycosyltransferase family 4 protein [Bradyrhizobium xenonodulans]
MDGIGISLDKFCDEMTGGWLFGYVSALQSVRLVPVLYCYSRAIDAPEQRVHLPSGCAIRLVPLPRLYRLLTRGMINPYAWRARDAFHGRSRLYDPIAEFAFQLSPYFAIARSNLTRSLRADGCAAVLVQEYEDPRFDRIVGIGQRARIPVFATFQGGDRHFRYLEDYTRPKAIAQSAGLIIASATEAERVKERYRPCCPIVDIPNPIDLSIWFREPRDEARRVLGWNRGERVAIYHGRIDIHRKGLDVLLSAWNRVRVSMPEAPVRLVVIGDGPDRDKFRELVGRVDAATLTWIPNYILDRPTMRRMLSAADVGVTASRHEGFAVAPLEAMACGLPIVATDAPGIPEILRGGRKVGGILCSRNDITALALGLAELLSDSGKAEEYGHLARLSVEKRFGLRQVGRRLAELIGKSRRSPS